MDNIKKNLANIVTLIGLIGAIGAGFVKYGQIEEKLANIAEPFDPSPLTKQIADNKDCCVRKNNTSFRTNHKRV